MEGCYPKVLYHAELDAVIVKSKAEHEAMGHEWAESPDEAKAKMKECVKPEADLPEKPKKRAPRAKA